MPELLRDIQRGEYTHLLSSPELIIGKRFRSLLRDPAFRTRVKWIAIDELHLVSVWGRNFRKSYALLEAIRHILGSKPWFGCTTTLDQPTFTRVCDYAAFRPTTKVMRLSTDRPEIAIIRARLKRHDKKSYKVLHFVVAEASKRPDESRLSVLPGFSQLRGSDSNISSNTTRGGTTLTESRTQRSLTYTPYKLSSQNIDSLLMTALASSPVVMRNPVSDKIRETPRPSRKKLSDIRYLFIHCSWVARLIIVGVLPSTRSLSMDGLLPMISSRTSLKLELVVSTKMAMLYM
jgi:hypothetical protein